MDGDDDKLVMLNRELAETIPSWRSCKVSTHRSAGVDVRVSQSAFVESIRTRALALAEANVAARTALPTIDAEVSEVTE